VRGLDAWDVGSVKGRPIAMVLVLIKSSVGSRWPSSLFMRRPVEWWTAALEGAVGSENGLDLDDKVWLMATNVIVGSGGVGPFFLIVRGTALHWVLLTSWCTGSLGCIGGLLGLHRAWMRASS